MIHTEMQPPQSTAYDVVHDYYTHGRSKGNFPLLDGDTVSAIGRFYRGPVANPFEPAPLCIGSPRLKKPIMADYLSLPFPPVVSSKIKNILEPLNLPCTQFVPATIRLAPPHDQQYWILHNCLELDVMDLEASTYTEKVYSSVTYKIDDFRLSADKLNALPVEARLLFRDFRTIKYLFWHKSLRDLVMAEQPTGIAFSAAHGRTPADAFRNN